MYAYTSLLFSLSLSSRLLSALVVSSLDLPECPRLRPGHISILTLARPHPRLLPSTTTPRPDLHKRTTLRPELILRSGLRVHGPIRKLWGQGARLFACESMRVLAKITAV